MLQLNEFGLRVKHRLIDLNKNQAWLIDEVNSKYPELYFDGSYLQKLMTGKATSAPMKARIEEILGI